MSEPSLAPNELADLYEGLFTLLENLPEETHPGWRFAIESVLFGGEGLAEDARPYGAQQAERNEFHISDYRDEYGNGAHVTDFPAIEAERVTPADEPTLDDPIWLSVAPDTQTVLPLSVDDNEFSTAIALLAEFPAEPNADNSGVGQQQFLAANRIPGVDHSHGASEPSPASTPSSAGSSSIAPNELVELYDALRSIHDALPEKTHPVWEEALETMLYGGETLLSEQRSYGKQQAERNEFRIRDYRDAYGDGETVTTFSIIERVASDESKLSETVLSPKSGAPLPLSPAPNELKQALLLLEEFPALPEAEDGARSTEQMLDTGQLLEKAYLPDTRATASKPDASDRPSWGASQPVESDGMDSDTEQADPDHATADTTPDGPSTDEPTAPTTEEGSSEKSTVHAEHQSDDHIEKIELLSSGVSETSEPANRSESQKYDDPRAQRAHKKHSSETRLRLSTWVRRSTWFSERLTTHHVRGR
jgi:hypothetical protein